MSAWRRVALAKLPEYHRTIEQATSPMALWIELARKFERTYELPGRDDRLITRFYEYARWCLAAPNNNPQREPLTSVIMAFFEHLPTLPAARNDLHRWLSREEFLNLEPTFCYFLDDAEFNIFKTDFMKKQNVSCHLHCR